MSYFNKFPLTNYKFNDKENYLLVNITKEINSSFIFDDPQFYIEYDIQDGDSPIIIADKLYGDPELAWTVLLFNKIVSPFEEWPMDYDTLINYISNKYDDVYAIHHYESLSTEAIVDQSHPSYDRYPVTNFEHETKINDSKRKIKLITSRYVNEYVDYHNKKVEVEL